MIHNFSENIKICSEIDYTIPKGIKLMNAEKMWNLGFTGKGIKIAILDSGCDINHNCLNNRIVAYKNFTNEGNENDVNDVIGHGTHVAGIIGANRHPQGITGVAPESDLYIGKVITNGEGDYQWIDNGLKWAIEQKVDIINMSLGGNGIDETMHTLIKEAVNNNICVVCAGGNDGDGKAETIETSYPAGFEESISVGAITGDDEMTNFSDSNFYIDLVTYGYGVLSCYPQNRYAQMSGTSQASPMAVGALALIKQWYRKQFHREPLECELYAQLIKNTITIPNIDRALQGNGRIYLNLN